MTRTKNATFQGALIRNVDPDAPTYKRVIKNVAGDLALIYDKLTGENAEANTITHGASGHGARLGMPVVNQLFGTTDDAYGVGAPIGVHIPGSTGKAGTPGDTIMLCYPFQAASMETEYQLEIVGVNLAAFRWWWHLTEFNDYDTYVSSGSFNVVEGVSARETLRARIDNTSPSGNPRILWIYADTVGEEIATDVPPAAGAKLLCASMTPGRMNPHIQSPMASGSASGVGVTTPSATQGTAFVDHFDALFADAESLHAWITHNSNRNANGLIEYLTGYPAHGRSSYTHVDHDGGGAPDAVNPARSRFFAHTRSLYASEPKVQIPLWSEAFGSTQDNEYHTVGNNSGNTEDGAAPLYGMLGHYAPYMATENDGAGGPIYCWRQTVQMPDLPNGGSSDLKGLVVCKTAVDDTGTPGLDDYEIAIRIGANVYTAVPTRMSGDAELAYATFSGMDFAPDEANDVSIGAELTTADVIADNKQMILLGACLYFAS